MNACIILIYPLTILCLLSPRNADGTKLSAITDEERCSVSRIYFEESNSMPPDELDRARTNPLVRKLICKEITQSGAFARYGLHPLSIEDERLVKDKSRRTTPSQSKRAKSMEGLDTLLDDIYNPEYPHQYTNWYKKRDIQVTKYYPRRYKHPRIAPRTEWVFVCLLKNNDPDRLFPVFVSKEYNVNAGLQAHRFAFFKWIEQSSSEEEDERYLDALLLVERSAEIFQEANFDVEEHYLEVRKHRKPAATARYDPVCKTNIQSLGYDQFFRLCAIVFSASYFKDKGVEYAQRVHFNRDFEKEIGFKADKHKVAASNKRYFERTLECSLDREEGSVETYFVSRAYNSYQVFVYSENSDDGKLYLEGLFTGVSIVHEKRDFGFPPTLVSTDYR